VLSEEQNEEGGVAVSGRLWMLLLAGISLVFVGIAVIVVASILLGGSGSVGGVILIGPIPIIFGSGPDALWLVLVGVIVSIISIVLFLVLNRRAGRN
jgi:uncharacterized membrane protein